MEPRTPILLDCDPGIDDALAILYAVRSPECELLGIGTVRGNVDAETGALNALRVLEVAGAGHVPVAVGCDAWLVEPKADARFVHGEDGLGNTFLPPPRGRPSGEHAVEMILRVTRERPGQVVLVAVGPLTNLAVALAEDPGLPRRVRQVVVMGGAARMPGNITPVAEANVAHDPEAARAVFAAGWPLTMVGLDVTMQALLHEEDAERLRASGDPVGAFAHRIVQFYMDFYRTILGRRACALHDPLAVAVALDPTLVRTVHTRVEVETAGRLTRGMTVVDLRGGRDRLPGAAEPNCAVCLEVDAGRFLQTFLARLGAA